MQIAAIALSREVARATQARPATAPRRSATSMHPGVRVRSKAQSSQSNGTSLGFYVVAVWARFLQWQMRRATRLLLNSLDDRTLADIGVKRSDIDVVLRDLEHRKARWQVGL